MILVLTNEEDLTTDFVIAELRRADVVRVNTERVGTEVRIAFTPTDPSGSGQIRTADRVVRFDEVTAVYARRAGVPEPLFREGDPEFVQYARVELLALIEGLSRLLPGRWMNHPLAVRRAESKPLQLAVARNCGMRVPQTIATNDSEVARAFCRDVGRVVVKSLSSPRAILGGVEHILFTTAVPEDDFDALADGVNVVPVIVQQHIEKRLDLRVTVVGSRVFAVAIHSQHCAGARVDWRAASETELVEELYELPEEVEASCHRLCGALGLSFGAIDLALDTDGNHWFFEVNPNGQWAWLQVKNAVPISKAIADYLCG